MSTKERKIKEKIIRRKNILEVAKKVFFSKGLEASTMEHIAKIAELSKGTLYLYFKSKEELYVSLVEEGASLFIEYFQNAVSPVLSASKKVKNLVDAIYSFYTKHRSYYEILSSIQTGSIGREKLSDEVYEKIHNLAMELLGFIENIVTDGIKSGEFIETDPRNTALSLWSLASGVFSISDFMLQNEPGEEKEKKLLDFASNMMLSRLQSEKV
jgi:AcrR family transcriptional regulator